MITSQAGAPYLLLEARTGNRDEACPGMWSGMCWDIYSNGSYVFTTYYIQEILPDSDRQYPPISHTGTMTQYNSIRIMLPGKSC